ncbi:MAG: PQQ-binding-like beta-propeller repeat protein [Caulobacterales bacterium]
MTRAADRRHHPRHGIVQSLWALALAPMVALAMAVTSGLAQPSATPAASAPTTAPAAPVSPGETLFKSHCASCHDPATGRAPDRARLKDLGLLEIFNAAKNGAMRPMAEGLSDDQIGSIAVYLAPPSMSAAAPAPPPPDPPQCPPGGRFSLAGNGWNGWGRDLFNTRLQPQPGFGAADVPKLKVKWSFAYAGGKYGQPTVIGGRLFLTSAGGKAYSLDARTGCMHWRVDGAPARTTVSVGRLRASPSGYAAFFGDNTSTVWAVDAVSGKLVWKLKVEAHPRAILSGAPALYQGRLYVPLSSYEELFASVAQYSCCTFRGGVVAIDAETGKQLWKTNVIDAAPAPTHKNSAGTQMFGPAGAAIWSAPTIDARRGLLYVATGDSYTDVKQTGSDAIVAIELASGKIKWRTQVTADDNYLSGCTPDRPLVNCPSPLGKDYDFGASPILFTPPGGGDILLAGQKSGIAYGLDPASGRILWRTQVGQGGPLGGIEFGMASDGVRLFVGNADAFMPSPPGRPGLYALDPATGKQLWAAPSPLLACGWTHGAVCMPGVSAPPTVIPGVVFAGDMNGRLRAYAAESGRVIWEVDTGSQTYKTVNGVAQSGGNLDGAGATVADGMLFVYSGYLSSLGGPNNNALLAFSVDGK